MKWRTMTLSAVITALATFITSLDAARAEETDANSEAVEFRKFCETAATSGSLLEKEKFLAWCEAEADRIATSPPSQAEPATEPPGPETGISSPSIWVDAVEGWRELSKRFGKARPAGPASPTSMPDENSTPPE
jgi:hypothetical protein